MSLIQLADNDRPFLEDDIHLIADHLIIPDRDDIATVLSGILWHVDIAGPGIGRRVPAGEDWVQGRDAVGVGGHCHWFVDVIGLLM